MIASCGLLVLSDPQVMMAMSVRPVTAVAVRSAVLRGGAWFIWWMGVARAISMKVHLWTFRML